MASTEEFSLKEPLMKKEDIETAGLGWRWSGGIQRIRSQRKSIFRISFVLFPWFLLCILGSWELCQHHKHTRKSTFGPSQLIYSPVQDLLEYELRTYNTGHNNDSPYVGKPTKELDDAWLSLYPSLFQLIPQEQAAQLVNKIVIFPHDPERRYIVELDVFHLLHCLNMVRQRLRPDYYKPSMPQIHDRHEEDSLYGPRQMDHCIEQIRQTIICHADVTSYIWKWDDEQQHLRGKNQDTVYVQEF